MSENQNKNNTDKSQSYVTTYRQGAIAANVFKRTAPAGNEYLDFSLSRAWKTPDGRQGYSQNFFVDNREAIHAVVDEACTFIAQVIEDSIETQEAA